MNSLDAMREAPEKMLEVSLGACEVADCCCPGASIDASGLKCVELSVRDSGCGMTEAVRKRLFHPFMSTKRDLSGTSVSGKGLGLFVSYGIVRRHGGRILCDSAPGQGTGFRVRLPLRGSLCGCGECAQP
ncbi:MAG: ATP-binding protein [Elusimicrobia bacterium]|nr:ATP-binding protein [Elusimicrobiota bacterium]